MIKLEDLEREYYERQYHKASGSMPLGSGRTRVSAYMVNMNSTEQNQLVQNNMALGTTVPAIKIPPPLPPLNGVSDDIPPSVCPMANIPPSVLPATIIKMEPKQEPAYNLHSNPFAAALSMGPIPNLFNVFQTIGTSDQLWSCHQCGEKGFTPKDLREHVRKKHWLPCLSCDTYCKDKQALQKHYMKMHSIEGLACKICQKVYSSRRKLQIHKRRVHESNPKYKCQECGYTARSKYRLGVHKRKHTGLKPLLCPCCGKGYADPINLNKHIKKVHGGKKWVGLKK